jgi:hypothetical protein
VHTLYLRLRSSWLGRPAPFDVAFAAVLAALYAASSALFFSKLDRAAWIDVALALVQTIARGAAFVAFAMLLADGLLRRTPRVRALASGLCFFVLVALFVDFILFRLMGTHLTYLVRIFYSGGWRDLSDYVAASRIGPRRLGLMLAIFPISTAIGAGLSHATRNLSARLGWQASAAGLLALTLAALALAFGEQAISTRFKDQKFWRSEQETFGLYLPLLRPRPSNVVYHVKLRTTWDESLDEEAVRMASQAPRPPAGRHVFLFVLESLRGDFVTPETAPNITRFVQDNGRPDLAHSNSNATMHGWFAIFHARHPFYWSRYNERPSFEGATPLRILKALGYKIALITAAELDYWGYQKSVFGDGYKLVDMHEDLSKLPQAPADRAVIDKAIAHLDEIQRSPDNWMINLFLESAHHDYQWGDEMQPRFVPYLESFDYTRVRYNTADLQMVINRYRNAVAYLDMQIGRFLDELRRRGMYEDSVVIMVGDHGEEFLEHGRMTHASNLFEPQIRPAFFMRLPRRGKQALHTHVSQVQIMPSVLDDLGWTPPRADLFDGVPVGTGGQPFHVINNVRSVPPPHRFLIHTGSRKLMFELDEDDPYHSTGLWPTRVLDGDDNEIPFHAEGPGLLHEIDDLYTAKLSRISFVERIDGPYYE